MVRRSAGRSGQKKNVVVLNDEAHHCYQSAPQSQEEKKLSGTKRADAKRDEEAARVWLNGLRAVQQKLGIRRSTTFPRHRSSCAARATPRATLFPWVVSDFSLIRRQIEAGIVKIPRVPVSDDAVAGTSPTTATVR